MTRILQAAAITGLAVGAGVVTTNVTRGGTEPFMIPEVPWTAGRALDGQVFETEDVIEETGAVLHDELHFRNGRFQSAMCQIYCDFGWSDYRTYEKDDVIHFTVTTRCPDAPHSVIWYGKVEDGVLSIRGRWTTERWYWTRHLNFVGKGKAAPRPLLDATG